MHLKRRFNIENRETVRKITLAVFIIAVVIVNLYCIFAAYKRYKRYKRRQSESSTSTESTSHELAVNDQPEVNSGQGNYRLNIPLNTNTNPEYCDPLPLYSPPSSSQIVQPPSRLNENIHEPPTYRVS